MSRASTNKLIDMIDEGLIGSDFVVSMCLSYMSEDDVHDMMHCNELLEDEEL